MIRKLIYTLTFLLAILQASAQTYTYDNNNRLTKVEYDNGITISYTYDALGNRLSKKVTGDGDEPVTPDATAYALLSADGKTLTFCYDGKRTERAGETFDLNEGGMPAWNSDPWDNPRKVVSVVFEPTFANVKPKSTYFWFCNFNDLENISGLNYLNTAEVTSMTRMFSYCKSLKNLDVSRFKTSNVSNMFAMFAGCSSLTDLDIRNFNISKVRDLTLLFAYCSNLKSLDLSNFDTSNATDMYMMFQGCYSLKSIDVSRFNTSKVTDFSYMFSNCSGLTSLNMSNFDMSSMTSSANMISGCSGLNELSISSSMKNIADNACEGIGTEAIPCAIVAPDNFDFGVDTSAGVFAWKGGHFRLSVDAASTAYAWLSSDGKTLTFCYDSQRMSRTGTTYDLNTGENYPDWNPAPSYDNPRTVTKVVFDASFAYARPKSTYSWFYWFSNLTAIEGINNLCTSEVTNMSRMFAGCGSLENIDLSHFNTSKVEKMNSLFWRSGVKTLNLSSFDTSNVTDMSFMFCLCGNLKTLDVSNFNTSKVEDMGNMFSGVGAEWLDLRNFDTSNVKSMSYMFADCFSLKGIDVSHFNTSNVDSFYAMFYRCISLVSLNVSNFDVSPSSSWYVYVADLFSKCTSLQQLCISTSMSILDASACSNVGTEENPCTLIAPDGFDFDVDTSKGTFVWKGGYFKLGSMLGISLPTTISTDASIYTLDGILVSRKATQEVLNQLPKGVYIIGGHKVCVK